MVCMPACLKWSSSSRNRWSPRGHKTMARGTRGSPSIQKMLLKELKLQTDGVKGMQPLSILMIALSDWLLATSSWLAVHSWTRS